MPPPDGSVPENRAITLWRKPPEIEEYEKKKLEIQKAEADMRLALAKARKQHAEMLQVGTDLVLNELKKCLMLAQSPDFANSVGPVEMKNIIKLAEFVSKNYRLDTGQATENIAHAVGPSIDFSKLTQAERDQWRALAMKGTGGGDGE